MNAKRTFCIILMVFILFSTVTLAFASDDRSYTIDQAIIDLKVRDSGLLHVEEQYDYTFDGAYNGVYRDIPLKSGESIDNVQVSAIGAYPVLDETDEDGQKHLKIYLYADKEHTEKIRDCSVSIFISYDMKNVVTLFNDVGALQYKLWGKEWDVGVDSVKATITLPGDENNTYFLNPEEYTVSNNTDGNEITAETKRIPRGEEYEVLILMPLDDFEDATYAKHINENGRDNILKNHNDSIGGRNFWNTAYLLFGLLSILSPVGAILTYLKYGREPKVPYDGIYERDLPTNDPPEVVNALVNNKKNIGRPNMKGFEASIMNLIDKKVLKLFNESDENTGTRELLLTFNNEKYDELSPSEKIVFNTLENFASNNQLNLSRLNGQLSSETNAKWFMGQIDRWEDSVKNGINIPQYFNDTGSTIILGMGILGIIFGIIITILGAMTSLGNGLYSIIGGIFLIIFSTILLFIDDDIFGCWTEKGRVFYLKWNNFRKFLKDNSLMKEHPPESIVIWRKYLIYGTSLGVAKNVEKAMNLHVPNVSSYDDGVFMYHYFGYHCFYNSYHSAYSTTSSSSSGGFGGVGGGSGGGGGGAF